MRLGWLSDAAVRASRLSRSAMPSPLSRAGAITLMATRRSRAMSWARYTVAMPPRPSSPRISYSPSVAWRTASSWAACDAAWAGWAWPCTTAVAMLACTPETSDPHRGQKRSAGPTGCPQRVQVGSDVIVRGRCEPGKYTPGSRSVSGCVLQDVGAAEAGLQPVRSPLRRPDPDAHLGRRGPWAVVQPAPQRVGVGVRQRLDAAHAAGHERGRVTGPDPPQRAETRRPARCQRLVRGDARAVGELRGRSARQPEQVGPSRVAQPGAHGVADPGQVREPGRHGATRPVVHAC